MGRERGWKNRISLTSGQRGVKILYEDKQNHHKGKVKNENQNEDYFLPAFIGPCGDDGLELRAEGLWDGRKKAR
jgi:hypothetical protein